MKPVLPFLLPLLLLLALSLAFGTSHAEPDVAALNKAGNCSVGCPGSWHLDAHRGGSRSVPDQVRGMQARVVTRPSQAIAYRYLGTRYTLADDLDRQHAGGLLVSKNGGVFTENHRYRRKYKARFLSFSMVKSVTSLLVGQAASLRLIASLADPAEKYVKALAGIPYGATTVRQRLANEGRAIDSSTGEPGPQQVVPLDYLLNATGPARQPPAFRPRTAAPYFGYGYQFWLVPLRAPTFAMQGIHGQTVYRQPSAGFIMGPTSVWESAGGQQNA